jgi:hypothetical protein
MLLELHAERLHGQLQGGKGSQEAGETINEQSD